MKKISKKNLLLILILSLAVFTRFFRLDQPPTYMFDEVYHAFTAVEFSKGNKMAWEWWNTPPKGFAYEWTHPPLAKEMMVVGIKVFGENPFAWRFPVILFGAGAVVLVYLLGKELFGQRVGLIAALLFNFDGLFFVQSRIGMNDTFFLFFMLLAFLVYTKYHNQEHEAPRKEEWGSLLILGIALGLALASKWTTIYEIAILGGLFIFRSFLGIDKKSQLRQFVKNSGLGFMVFLVIPILVYLLSYLPFFTSGHTWQQFNELQYQMWWYHTNLKATHPYMSLWYTWPIMYRPVWYYVNYGQEKIANVYAMGNPAIWWPGIVAVGYVLIKSFKMGWGWVMSFASRMSFRGGKEKSHNSQLTTHPFLIVLLGYFGFFLPWAFSPRIMFLYHYLPSVPFMCLALGYGLDKLNNIKFRISNFEFRISWMYLLVVLVVFVYFYPQLSGLPVPKWWAEQYFWFPSWK